MLDVSLKQKEFEATVARWAEAAGVPVKFTAVNINGTLGYYMHPSIQAMWEANDGRNNSKGKDY